MPSGICFPVYLSISAMFFRSSPADPRAAIDAVLPDEFPLSVFYEPLRRRLGPVIESARGITGVAA